MFKIFITYIYIYICWINIQNATLEVSGAVRPLYGSLGVKVLTDGYCVECVAKLAMVESDEMWRCS